MFGIDRFTAVLNPPEPAILAVGRARPAPVARDGEVVIRDVMTLTLSVDHRALQGADGARLLGRIAELLERPARARLCEWGAWSSGPSASGTSRRGRSSAAWPRRGGPGRFPTSSGCSSTRRSTRTAATARARTCSPTTRGSRSWGRPAITRTAGGQMTWHGPGQSVGYAIADLRRGRRVRGFVTALAEAMAEASGVAGAAAGESAMGAYVGGRKLGSVGIRVAEGVSTHGLALNRDPDPRWFAMMTACGAPEVPVTSIALEGGDPDRDVVEARLAGALAERLGLALEPVRLEDLLAEARRAA